MNELTLESKRFFIKGSILIFIGILLGAFAAHALKEILSGERIVSFQTGVRYQIWGGFFMFILGFLSSKISSIKLPGNLIFAGVILFSLSIYFLNLRFVIGLDCDCFKPLGIITPIGGVLMIVGWGMVIYRLMRTNPKESL